MKEAAHQIPFIDEEGALLAFTYVVGTPELSAQHIKFIVDAYRDMLEGKYASPKLPWFRPEIR